MVSLNVPIWIIQKKTWLWIYMTVINWFTIRTLDAISMFWKL